MNQQPTKEGLMEEENLHRNKQSVASLKVSAEAEIACNTEEEPQQQHPFRDTCQSRTSSVEDTTRATEHSAASPDIKVAAAASMGEAASLKRAACSVDGLLLSEDGDRKKPAKQLKTKNSKDGAGKKKRTPNNNKKEGSTAGRWNASEHAAFLQGLALYGREWKRVAADIPTRSASQVRSHAQKYFAKLQKEQEEEWIHQANQQLSNAAAAVVGGGADPVVEGGEAPLQLSTSVRREAARILAHPETVESEVRSTLHQLRERYKQLQRRLEERSSVASLSSNHSAVSDDEMIALHVLQGGLKSKKKEKEYSGQQQEQVLGSG